MKKRPIILTIAGFDPSSGAGLTADLKVFEAHKCYGMAVQTANTIQTEDVFRAVNWIEEKVVLDQLTLLLGRYDFAAVKVGLIPSFAFLIKTIKLLRSKNEKVLIVWDPVLSTSSNFDFQHDLKGLDEVLGLVDWITPNWNEMKRLSKLDNPIEGARLMASSMNVYLKGGHNEKDKGKDFLFNNKVALSFNAISGNYSEKHGSGCVFSAALISNLVRDYTQQKSVLKAKRYTEHFLASNTTLLGYHK